MEKWLCGAHIARTHKDAVDRCQLLQTTLTPPGWMKCLTRYMHLPKARDFLVSLCVLLSCPGCSARFGSHSSCEMLRNCPWKPPQDLFHMSSLAACPVFNNNL